VNNCTGSFFNFKKTFKIKIMTRKYSVFLGNVGTCNDRHCPQYSEKKFSLEEKFERVASIDLMTGVDLVADKEMVDNYNKVKKALKNTGLKAVSIVVDLFGSPLWKQGSFSSVWPEVRKQAREDTKRTMDFAEELGCEFITIWPGQDGFDYMFQADYMQERTWFADGVREACRYKPNIGIALEYKIREPRTHNYINTVGNTILTVKEVSEPNCGIAMDIGHAFFAYENSAESVALMKKWGGNLMHIHINDNYSYADDDLIVGSNRTIEYLEFIYWLRKTGYNGWFTMDQFPYREDGKEAVQESVYWLDKLEKVIDKADSKEIDDVIAKKDAVLANKLMRKLVWG
jgi:xylose isomerase